jgi:hypothetical protein
MQTNNDKPDTIAPIDLAHVRPRDRWKIEHIVRIVCEEFERCMGFGMSPGVDDYRYSILNWLENGMAPSEFQKQIGGAHF